MAGQTINDRLLAARHSLAGQGLAKSVCKATTEEMIAPKKKHLDYLVHCTNEPNVSIPQLANLLIERSQSANWTVVFKSLTTTHHLMCYGNERFTQYLASSNSTFQLGNFLDKSGVQAAGARVAYDMSPFIRRYAKYLNEKALSYRTVAFDFCKMKRGKEDGTMRTINAEKLLKTLPVLQAQLDALLEFDCSPNDLTNGVINVAFMLLFRDLIRLFAGYNDGIINLLEKYFDMNKKQCRDALDLYKKFLIRMDRVGEFLKVAENVGIDKGDIPDLTKAPSSLLDALEQHLATLEGRKGSLAGTPTQSASNRTNVKSGVSALSSTSTAFGTAVSNQRLESAGNGHIDEALRQQALAEEEAAMNQYKAKVQSPTSAASTNPFLSAAAPGGQPIVDFFGNTAVSADAQKASDDLLQLGNPFADMFGGAQPAAPPAPAQNNMWMANGFSTVTPAMNNFVTDNNFSSVFGSQDSQQGTDGNVPNPFAASLGSDANQSSSIDNQSSSDFFNFPGSTSLFGSEVPEAKSEMDRQQTQSARRRSSGPPPRPPPPVGIGSLTTSVTTVGSSHTPRSASPAVSTGSGQSKSAFDDLNDSIRAALGTSPARNIPLAQQQQQVPIPQQPQMQQHLMMQPGPMMTMNYGIPSQIPIGFASPAKQPVTDAGQPTPAPAATGKVLTGDLDSSLASLAENLSINKSAQPQKGMQWNSPAKSGGQSGWTPQPMAATTGAGYRPMTDVSANDNPTGQGMTQLPPAVMHFPAQTTPMAMQGMQMGMPGIRPMMPPGAPVPGAMMMAPPGANPMMMGTPGAAAPAPMQQQQPITTQPQNNNVQLDPFGAL